MRATTCSTPNVSRATRAAMMLELSPLLTAAKAPAVSMPASSSVWRAKPRAVTWRPPEAGAPEALGVRVDAGDAGAPRLQPPGDRRADAAADHHDHVHLIPPRLLASPASPSRPCGPPGGHARA